ncbi:MAG: ATP-dependent Clp protease ATP-binding subunit ClpA, partial [Betaproteobacteria bacterium]|nr:ATP-dependent Clp protease ATP-binding subunit ClpA [Betaproteobacteria bacterium]
MITQELEENINFTRADARRRRLGAVTVEHLVLVLIDNSSVRRCLAACNADMNGLRRDLNNFLEANVAQSDAEPAPTEEFHRVLKRAVGQTRASSQNKASGAHVLAAVFAEPGSRAAYYLCKHGVERLAVLACANQKQRERKGVEWGGAKPAAETENDLVALAAAGRLEEPFGREMETAAVVRVLARKYKNSPLLVGEPGVGKTAVAHKLAHYALRKDAPPGLSGLALFSVSVGELVAGQKRRPHNSPPNASQVRAANNVL